MSELIFVEYQKQVISLASQEKYKAILELISDIERKEAGRSIER